MSCGEPSQRSVKPVLSYITDPDNYITENTHELWRTRQIEGEASAKLTNDSINWLTEHAMRYGLLTPSGPQGTIHRLAEI